MPELLPHAPGSPEWLAARRQGVTATDIVTILGLPSWDSPYSLFWRKMGQVPETPDNDRFRLGRALEQYITDRWETDPERDPTEYPEDGGLWCSSDRPWQLATLDRQVHHALDYPALYDNDPVVAVLECKSWADAARHQWQDQPPSAVRAQVLWQMDVRDVATGHVGVVFLPSGEFRSYVIECQCKMLDFNLKCEACLDIGLMREAGEKFMARLRLELPPPDPDSSEATLAAVKARFARQPEKQAEVDQGIWNAWVSNRFLMSQHEELARGLEAQLREQAGEASVLIVDGQPVARRIISVHTATWMKDYYRRITPKNDSDE